MKLLVVSDVMGYLAGQNRRVGIEEGRRSRDW
jgi:hypothetical protein